jgi:hypothetical protein
MLSLINLIVCPMGDVPTPLSCCKVSVGNSYKAFTRKIQNDPNRYLRMSVLVDSKLLSESFFMSLSVNIPEGSEL